MISPPSGWRVGALVRHPAGGGDGPGLLLVHGFMGSAESWIPLIALLPDDWRIAAVTLPGHRTGVSDRGSAGTDGSHAGSDPAAPRRDYEIPAMARLLGEVQEVLFPGPAWWLGYSMGGRIALSAAVQGVPQRGLLLESASAGIRDPEERAARRAADEARAHRLEKLSTERCGDPGGPKEDTGMAAFVEEWLALPLFAGLRELDPDARRRAFRIRAGQDPVEMAAWLRRGGAGSQPWYGDGLAGLSRPVHALVGSRDEKYVDLWTGFADRVAGVRTTVAPGRGHIPHLEDPALWAAWVRSAVE